VVLRIGVLRVFEKCLYKQEDVKSGSQPPILNLKTHQLLREHVRQERGRAPGLPSRVRLHNRYLCDIDPWPTPFKMTIVRQEA
jgi:hypothetical protein